jgi:hypothetical protein
MGVDCPFWGAAAENRSLKALPSLHPTCTTRLDSRGALGKFDAEHRLPRRPTMRIGGCGFCAGFGWQTAPLSWFEHRLWMRSEHPVRGPHARWRGQRWQGRATGASEPVRRWGQGADDRQIHMGRPNWMSYPFIALRAEPQVTVSSRRR